MSSSRWIWHIITLSSLFLRHIAAKSCFDSSQSWKALFCLTGASRRYQNQTEQGFHLRKQCSNLGDKAFEVDTTLIDAVIVFWSKWIMSTMLFTTTLNTIKPRIARTIRSRNSTRKWGARNGCFKRNTRFFTQFSYLRRFSLSVWDL